MKANRFLQLCLVLCLSLAVSATASAADAATGGIAASATEVHPILLGSAVPDVGLRTLEGEAVRLRDAIGGKPTMIVFYRGGWCPYCNLQLQGLRLVRGKLEALGFSMLAISPDRPESIRATLEKTPLDYTLLSDSAGEAMRAFGIAFRVDDATLGKYQEYGIDLEAASGETHHALPVPAVYLADAAGVLQFSYVHPDYTVRVPERVVLAAAEAILAQEQKLKRGDK